MIDRIRKIYKERKEDFLFALYFPVYLGIYFFIEKIVPNLESIKWITTLGIDKLIPFYPGMIVMYIAWYPLLIITGLYLFFNDSKSFKKYMTFMIIGFTSAQIFMLIIPNGQNLRPINYLSQLKPDFFTILLNYLYKIDTPTNVFPSVHVIGSFMVIFAFLDNEKLSNLKYHAIILCCFISASTLLIKQHAFIDLIGGIVFSLITRIIVNKIFKEKKD